MKKSWAASILGKFCKEPTVSDSRRVAAFLHGNGISAKDAAKLYKACQAAWRNISEIHMYGWYMQWAKRVPSTLFYYNMKRKYVMWLGRDEGVEPEITVRKFGPAASEQPVTINQRITELRRDWIERGEYM